MVKQLQKLLLQMFSTTDPLKYFFFQAIFSLGSLFGCHCQTSPKYFNKHEIYFIRTQKKKEKKNLRLILLNKIHITIWKAKKINKNSGKLKKNWTKSESRAPKYSNKYEIEGIKTQKKGLKQDFQTKPTSKYN